MVSVLRPADIEDKLTETIMRETSTLGIRTRRMGQHIAQREIIEFVSSFGPVHTKVKRFGKFVSVSPEYEDCRKIALERNLLLQEVSRIIENEARKSLLI